VGEVLLLRGQNEDIKLYSESARKAFITHTQHSEPVLSTALKCSARDE